MELAGPPAGETVVPEAVAEWAAGRPVEAIWVNQLGGTTFRVGGPPHEYVKWAPDGSGLDLSAERDRLIWAGAHARVPKVLGHGTGADGAWLATAGIDGESAVSSRWKTAPETAVTAIGRGLRMLHDDLPVADCPFDWSLEVRLAAARDKTEAGRQDPDSWHEVHHHLSVEEAMDRLAAPPEIDRLVVCHGDACAPNTLIGADGTCVGHVDLGALGVADRWADIAIATWSTEWNYGPGWEATLLDAYGIDPDPERTAWYRLLWDLT